MDHNEAIFTSHLENGVTVIHEPMPWLQSTSITISLPYGTSHDPGEHAGAHYVAAEWMSRGAGSRSARELADFFDNMGAQWSIQPSRGRLVIAARALTKDLDLVFSGVAEIIVRPQLADEEFLSAKNVVKEEFRSIEDNYTRRLIETLVQEFVGGPLGRKTRGSLQTLESLTPEIVRNQVAKFVGPASAVIGVAGSATEADILRLATEHFGAWTGDSGDAPTADIRGGQRIHITEETEQVHIAFGWAAPSPTNISESLLAQFAGQVLSGGMGARLFAEVREKRGLVYSVSASYTSFLQYGAFIGYAGTTQERAQETLDVYQEVIRELKNGVAPEEFTRAMTGLLSSIILAGESPGARSSRLANSWILRGAVRTLEEIQADIESVTLDALNDYLANRFAFDPVIVTLGPGSAS